MELRIFGFGVSGFRVQVRSDWSVTAVAFVDESVVSGWASVYSSFPSESGIKRTEAHFVYLPYLVHETLSPQSPLITCLARRSPHLEWLVTASPIAM